MADFKEKVKNAVKNNFKLSTSKYFEFENKYNLFYNLTVSLGKFLDINPQNKVLDIGCGYGVSVNAIKSEFKVTDITGVDISEEMIDFGKKLYPDLNLIVCDGEEIVSLFNNNFDIIVYNASIFIFPDTLTAFNNAYNLLEKNGKIGFTHYPEIISKNGDDLFSLAYKINNFKEPKKRVITDFDTCILNLEKSNFKNITTSTFKVKLDVNFITEFFLIPAQSASLFPKTKYEERTKLIRKLFSVLEEFSDSSEIIWKMAKAEKI